jgi:hypothetical protein
MRRWMLALTCLLACRKGGSDGGTKHQCSSGADPKRVHQECSAVLPLPDSEGLWTCQASRCVWQEIRLKTPGVTPSAGGICLSSEAAESISKLDGVELDLDHNVVTLTGVDGETISGAVFRDTTIQCQDRRTPPAAGNPNPTPVAGQQCGPDMTTRTFDVMQLIIDEYQAATPAQQQAACASLVTRATAEHAWDIYPYYPGPRCPDEIAEIARTSGCGVPCHPCASGVVFLDRCINYQVLNYVFWGVSAELCGQQNQQQLLSSVRSLNSVHHDAQGNAMAMGILFASGRTQGASQDSVHQAVENMFERSRATWAALPENGCARTCSFAWPTAFTYHWTGIPGR